MEAVCFYETLASSCESARRHNPGSTVKSGIALAVYTACTRKLKNVYSIIIQNFKRRHHMGDLGIDGMVILKRIL
jgi:hypothetical protein